jgi:protein involved in ribonucleotide reduction
MRIIYDSKTGLGKKFAEKLPYPVQSVSEPLSGPCILITRNEGLGLIPKSTQRFLKQYSALVRGVVINGNKRFGRFYCAAGPKIESHYHVPVIRNIEGEGIDTDVQVVVEFLRELQSAKGDM